jgi:hypothetical protein
MTDFRAGPAVLLSLCASLLLSGCVMTGAEFAPTNGAASSLPARSHNPGEIKVTEAIDVGRPYKVIGKVDAYARSVNLSSSDPTRADIDEALRAEAAKRGADAVVLVSYETERAGLASRGKMSASGYAVAFKP